MIEQKDYLKDVIGIEPIKRQILFHIKNFEVTGIAKNYLIVGPKGAGKSRIAREVAKCYYSKDGKIRKFIEINCASLKDVNEFMGIFTEHIHNQEVTIYLDESEELSKDISILFLTLLAVNDEYKNNFNYSNEKYCVDFRKQSFIFTTTSPEKMLEPLVNRLELVNLPQYSKNELARIIAENLKHIKTSNDVLLELASVVRGSPRDGVKLAQNIDGYLKRTKKNYLSLEDIKNIYQELSILPLGLNFGELEILKLLKENKNCSLTRAAAILGSSVQSLRRFEESYLLKQNLIEISTAKGRNLTMRGLTYLNQLNKDRNS